MIRPVSWSGSSPAGSGCVVSFASIASSRSRDAGRHRTAGRRRSAGSAGLGRGRLAAASAAVALLPLGEGLELADQRAGRRRQQRERLRAPARATGSITWPIKTSRLGSLVMSSTCSGPTTTPSTAPPLISGFLRVLTWAEISLASSAIPSPPQAIAEGPFEVLREPVHPHVGEDAAGQRVLQHPQPDRLLAQVAAEPVLGDGVQVLEVQDQERPAAVEVRPKLIHHQFFNIFAHGFGLLSPACDWMVCLDGRSLGRVDRPRRDRDAGSAQAETRMPGLMVAETVIERM